MPQARRKTKSLNEIKSGSRRSGANALTKSNEVTMKPSVLKTARWIPFASLVVVAIAASGCKSVHRKPQSEAYLLQRRDQAHQTYVNDSLQHLELFIAQTKAQYDDYSAGRRNTPPVIDVLVISGGGDWG